MQIFCSLIFRLSMWSSLLVFIPLGLLISPFPFVYRYRFLTLWPRFHVWFLKNLCGVEYYVEGKENLPQGAAIVMAKHQSTWETFAFTFIFPPQVWVLKRELMWLPLFGWGLALLRPIAINRGSGKHAMEQLVTQGRQRLDNGQWVMIFPEGTRMPANSNSRGRYKLGGSVLASETGYPVVPVAHNAGTCWPRRRFLISRGVIRVVIGPVIETKGRSVKEISEQVENWIETKMQELEGRSEPAKLLVPEK